MKYSVAVMLLIGAMSTSEALTLEQKSLGFLQAESDLEMVAQEDKRSERLTKSTVEAAQKKAKEAS